MRRGRPPTDRARRPRPCRAWTRFLRSSASCSRSSAWPSRISASISRWSARLAQCLLVGPAFGKVRLRVALVGDPVAFVGHPIAFVGQPLAFVGLAFADLRVNLTLVG